MIFCVDDDDTIREIEVYTLKQTGFEAKGFSNSEDLFEALKTEMPDLIVLDIMLPDKDGIEILTELRLALETKDIPVIMATAKGTEMDKIQGLDKGADDYLVKPFGPMEMVSRIKAVLRRCQREVSTTNALTVGDIVLKDNEHKVTVKGERVNLTLKEYELLKTFMQNLDMVFTREMLLSKVWGVEHIVESRTVDMHVKTLRRKLGEAGKLIETIIGVGYRMEVKV